MPSPPAHKKNPPIKYFLEMVLHPCPPVPPTNSAGDPNLQIIYLKSVMNSILTYFVFSKVAHEFFIKHTINRLKGLKSIDIATRFSKHIASSSFYLCFFLA